MNLTKKIVSGSLIGLQLCSMAVFAQEEERAYDASVSLGYVGTTGNTKTETFNTEALLTLRSEKWVHNVKFQALGSSEDDEATAERYYLENKSDYPLNEGDEYLFVLGSYTDDRFSGYDYQAAISAGYGKYFQRTDDFSLQGYAGVGYRQSEIEGIGSDGEVIFTLGENLEWAMSESSKITQAFVTEIGDELTVSKFDVALESNIIGNISTRIAFQARHNSEVPAGLKKTDTQTSISLAYIF